MCLRDFDELVAEFVATPKQAVRAPRWRSKRHSDYAALSIWLEVKGKAHLRGRVVVTAHRFASPARHCFSLLFRRERVLALDVNPARSHRNLLTKGSISITHWHRWPAMEAEPQDGDKPFRVWLHEFLVAANVVCNHAVAAPPRVG